MFPFIPFPSFVLLLSYILLPSVINPMVYYYFLLLSQLTFKEYKKRKKSSLLCFFTYFAFLLFFIPSCRCKFSSDNSPLSGKLPLTFFRCRVIEDTSSKLLSENYFIFAFIFEIIFT